MSVIPCTEAQAQKAVMDLFRLYGWEVRRMEEDWHNRDGYGIPDLLCTSPHGLQLWVEMKRAASSRNRKGRVRKAQKELLIEWRRRGVPCCVAGGVTETLQHLAEAAASSVISNVNITLIYCDLLCTEYPWWPGRAEA